MLRLRSTAILCKRASALTVRSSALLQGSAVEAASNAARNYAVLTAAGVGAAAKAGAAAMGGTVTLRIMGYNVPYPVVLGTALAVAGGVYWYECVAQVHEKEAPLIEYMESAPHIRSLDMKDQDGRPFSAKDLSGKFAVVAFGTASSDAETVANIAKACESVKQRSGTAVDPVFISLDPSKDRPADLKRLVQTGQQGGSMDMVALSGDADQLLSCANKYKKQELSARVYATRDQESIKKKDAVDPTYVSSFVYVVNPNGDFVSMMSKDLPTDKMANQICLSI